MPKTVAWQPWQRSHPSGRLRTARGRDVSELNHRRKGANAALTLLLLLHFARPRKAKANIHSFRLFLLYGRLCSGLATEIAPGVFFAGAEFQTIQEFGFQQNAHQDLA